MSQGFAPLPPAQLFPGIPQNHRRVLLHTGISITINVTGMAVIPLPGQVGEFFHGTKNFPKKLTPVNIQVPIDKKIFIPGQAGKPYRPSAKLPLQFS
jgi:hypothetical protein